MKLALVSDTHLPRFGTALPRALLDGFEAEGIDHVVHAGDWTDPIAVSLLESVAPVDGVAGNNDGPPLTERFGTRLVLDFDGVLVGVTHGHIGPASLTTPERALLTFMDMTTSLGAIVFGHSHIPLIDRLPGGTWLVNPGSPTDKRRQPAFTWAVMELGDGGISRVELRSYADRSTG